MTQRAGVDIGTMFIAAAKPSDSGTIVTKKRNCFVIIKGNPFNKKIYTGSGKVDWMPWEGEQIALIGDNALEYANSTPMPLDVRRPLKDGILNKSETSAYPMLRAIVESVIGQAKNGVCTLSIPAPTIDVAYLIDHHRSVLMQILSSLGWNVSTIHEGYCVILSTLAETQFTGIGISFGGGMVNVSFSFMAEEMFAFSMQQSGDWIDQVASESSRYTKAEITDIKETQFSLDENNIGKDGHWQIESAYNSLIDATIENICIAFESLKKPPRIKDPLPVVIAGGTSMVPGFVKRFEERFRASRFPVPVGGITHAAEPLFAVARGALLHATTVEGEETEVKAAAVPVEEPKPVEEKKETQPEPTTAPEAPASMPEVPAGFRPVKKFEDKSQ